MLLLRLELGRDNVVDGELAVGVRIFQRWAFPHTNHVAVERGVRAVAGRQCHRHRGGGNLCHLEGAPMQQAEFVVWTVGVIRGVLQRKAVHQDEIPDGNVDRFAVGPFERLDRGLV